MADNVQFPIEAGHVMLFRRAVGYPDADASTAVPPTFAIASAQFDPDYPLRPTPGEPWFGSGKNPTSAAPSGGSGDGPPALHAEQHFTYHRPIRIGETLTVSSEPGESWEREGRAGLLKFSERFTHYRDADGNDVVTGRSVGVRVFRNQEAQ
jgi:N-terminal half of MaoC dehydratase